MKDSIVKNRFFTLMIIPDSGNDIKSSNFNSRFLLTKFVSLFLLFFVCLFIITGYYIKYKDEKIYRKSIMENHALVKNFKELNPTNRNTLEFLKYFDKKKNELIQTEEKLNELKSENKRLEPIVKVNREIIENILDMQLNKQQEHYKIAIWRDRLFSCIIGVITSIIGAIVYKKLIN